MPARRGAKKSDALRIDAELARLAAHEWHCRHPILQGLRKHLGLGREPVADGEQRGAARCQIRSPILEGAARALKPGAAMHGNQRRRGFDAFRQIKVANQLNAVVVGIGDAVFDLDRIIRHVAETSLSCRAKKSMSSRLASSARSMLGQWPQSSSTCSSALRNFGASSLA